jgi:hypothetical protein
MTMRRLALAVLACGLFANGPAMTQDAAAPPVAPPAVAPSPGSDDSRYTFHRVQDNFVRLDGRTGDVSVCGQEAMGWTCRAVPDERAALEAAIGRLQGDNAALKRELLARGLPLPSGMKADPPAVADANKAPAKPADPGLSPKLPSDAEVERVMGFIEKVWRRLVELMVDFQRDMQRKS